MLRKIGFENFKAFGKYREFELGNLNLIAGKNSSGKSSIYQALFLLAQSTGRYLEDKNKNRLPFLKFNGSLVKLGRTNEILFNSEKKQLSFMLEWTDGMRVDYSFFKHEGGESSINDENPNNFFCLSNISYSMNGEEIFSANLKENGWEVSAHSILSFAEYNIQGILRQQLEKYAKPDETIFCEHVVFKNVIELDLKNNFLDSFKIRQSEIELVIKPQYRKLIDWALFKKTLQERKIDEEFPMLYSDRTRRWSLYLLRESNIEYLPPFRGYPKRLYVQNVDENPLDTFTVNSDMQVTYDFSFEDNSIKKDSLKTAFNYWVAEHFEIGDQVTVEDRVDGLASEIYVWQDQKKIPIINVGFGASQILPVIFRILVHQKKSLIVIDEPEIHLHPSLQSKLADFFFRMALIGKKIFIETHSEYLIDRMIYLSIKHETFSKSNVFLDWVNKVDGESSFERIKYDSLGFLQNAPKGFLNEKQVLVEDINALRVSKLV